LKDKDIKTTDNTQKKKKSLLLIALKRHKVGLLVVILLLCLSSTLAWFIYNTTVNLALTGKVKAWNVSFDTSETGGTAIFTLPDLYPGMPAVTHSDSDPCDMDHHCIAISNNGELSADASLVVKYLYLFGEEQTGNYTVTPSSDGTYTISSEDYPFNLKFKFGSTSIAAGEVTDLYFTLDWPYEKTNADYTTECPTATTHAYCTDYDTYLKHYDAIDTAVGEQSYEFNESGTTVTLPTELELTPEEIARINRKSLIIVITVDFVQSTNP
jgi:hypothetical protein